MWGDGVGSLPFIVRAVVLEREVETVLVSLTFFLFSLAFLTSAKHFIWDGMKYFTLNGTILSVVLPR